MLNALCCFNMSHDVTYVWVTRRAMLWCAMLCPAVLCCAVLCCAVLCCSTVGKTLHIIDGAMNILSVFLTCRLSGDLSV